MVGLKCLKQKKKKEQSISNFRGRLKVICIVQSVNNAQ